MKPFYKSKTLWANGVVIAVIAVSAVFGLDLNVVGQDVDTEVQTVALGVVNVVLRLFTNTAVTSGSPPQS